VYRAHLKEKKELLLDVFYPIWNVVCFNSEFESFSNTGMDFFPDHPESGARLLDFDLPPLFVATIHSTVLLVR
jgi:hypothetical protein